MKLSTLAEELAATKVRVVALETQVAVLTRRLDAVAPDRGATAGFPPDYHYNTTATPIPGWKKGGKK